MIAKRKYRSVGKAAVAALAMGMLWGSSCGSNLDVLAAGLGAAAREIDRNSSSSDDDITLGDWLADEVSDF